VAGNRYIERARRGGEERLFGGAALWIAELFAQPAARAETAT
jgi:hypothetical protein